MNSKIFKIFMTVIASLCIAAGVVIITCEIAFEKKYDNVFKTVVVIASMIAAIVKINGKSQKPPSAKEYRKIYASVIGRAFENDPAGMKQLVTAIHEYNCDRFASAIKRLRKLGEVCVTAYDRRAVGLFTALCYIDMHGSADAISVLNELITRGCADATIYGNLGYAYMHAGDEENAVSAFETAISLDPNDYTPYMNLANLNFRNYRLKEAEEYALRALELDNSQHQPPALLAMIYALSDDQANAERYFHIAISKGENPEKLKAAIEYYRSNRHGE